MKKFIKYLFLFIVITSSPLKVISEEFSHESFGYFLDIPDGWGIIDSADLSKIAFADPTNTAVLQIFTFKRDSFASSVELYNHIKSQLKAQGEGDSFIFSVRDAVFSDLSFNTGKYDVRGYFVFINGIKYDFALFCFTPLHYYDKYHDFLLSSLDSFSPDEQGKLLPGPVSQYYYPFPGAKQQTIELKINRKIIKTSVDEEEMKATQILVEREAKILAAYKRGSMKAWHRYYRMIYRDNYQRLKGLSTILKHELGNENKGSNDIVINILSWIQKFTYYRTNSLADFTSPLASAYTLSGDCDSRALLFVILLHHLGIDSRLLVSIKYMHSAVGVNIQVQGAKFNFDGKDYFYAEMTEEVDIGLVPQKMADLFGWTSMQFGKF